jgi:DNA-binding transcriptional LysR family regulator
MRYDLYSLTLFSAVADSGSIAQAAASHNIAASAVSKRIADLESLVGTPLFYRQQRGVVMTQAGHELHRHARALNQQIARLDAAMSEFAEGNKGTVRIAANTSSITQFLPEDLAAFAADYPDIRIQLVELFSTEVVAAVRSGASDIGICSGLTDPADLAVTIYRRDTLVLATPAGHPLAKCERIALEDILEYDIVSLQNGSSIRAFIEARAEEIGREVRTRVQVVSFDGVRRMVQAQLGVAILPYGAVATYLAPSDLAMVPIADPWASRELWIVQKKADELSKPTRILLDYLTGKGHRKIHV